MKSTMRSVYLSCGISFFIFIHKPIARESLQKDSLNTDSVQLSVVASPVTVHATREQTPYTISSIDQRKIELCTEPIITPLLNATPGLWMQSGALNTNRISIRGVGYREPFATTGIKIYLDEIPLTNGVGESSIEDIHPGILSGMDIWRGPASSLWGSGLGGMINLKSHVPLTDEGRTNIQVGSFNRLQFDQRLDLRYGQNDTWGTTLHYQYLNDEGYRDNNQYRKHSLTWMQHWNGVKGLSLNTLLHAIGLKAFIPSSLNLDDYQHHPSNAAPTWADVMGNEDYTKWITGINFSYAPEQGWVYKGAFFGTFFDSDEVRPFNVLDEHSVAGGMRHRFSFKLFDDGHITTGMEYYKDKYSFSTYETLEGGTAGMQISDESENRSYLNVFLQTEWELGNRWYLFAGLNSANSHLSDDQLKANLPVDFYPTFGATYSLKKNFSISGSVSRGYAALALDDMLDADGMLNEDIVPETGWNEEISFKYGNDQGSFVKMTLFHMNIMNTVLTRRIMDDLFEKINGGSSLHRGVELEYKWMSISQKFNLEGAYTHGNYTFDQFIEGNMDFSGNQLPGTALHNLYSRLNWTPVKRWTMYMEYQWIDDVFLNDANTVKGNGYQLVNAGMRYDVFTGTKWNGTVSGTVYNMFDTHFASMYQINAPGIQPRYYYPGKPFSVYLNMSVTYKL